MRPEQPGGSAVEAKRATTLLAVITFAGGVWCVCGLLEGGVAASRPSATTTPRPTAPAFPRPAVPTLAHAIKSKRHSHASFPSEPSRVNAQCKNYTRAWQPPPDLPKPIAGDSFTTFAAGKTASPFVTRAAFEGLRSKSPGYVATGRCSKARAPALLESWAAIPTFYAAQTSGAEFLRKMRHLWSGPSAGAWSEFCHVLNAAPTASWQALEDASSGRPPPAAALPDPTPHASLYQSWDYMPLRRAYRARSLVTTRLGNVESKLVLCWRFGLCAPSEPNVFARGFTNAGLYTRSKACGPSPGLSCSVYA